MTRAILDNCRPNVTRNTQWNGHQFTVTIGFDAATWQPIEVFADTAKGGDIQWSIADACVVISIALQNGIAPADLAKSLARVPVQWGEEGQTAPASVIGAVLDAILAEVME